MIRKSLLFLSICLSGCATSPPSGGINNIMPGQPRPYVRYIKVQPLAGMYELQQEKRQSLAKLLETSKDGIGIDFKDNSFATVISTNTNSGKVCRDFSYNSIHSKACRVSGIWTIEN